MRTEPLQLSLTRQPPGVISCSMATPRGFRISCESCSVPVRRLCSRDPDTLRQGFTVGFYELIHHLCYLVEREHARSMAVEHGGVIDVVPPALQRRPDREVLDSGVRGAGRRALRREIPDVAGTKTGVVGQDRYLDTAPCGEVRNEAGVLDVAVDGPRLAGDERMHDERAVLHAAPQREFLSGEQFATGLRILDEVLLAAPDVLVNRHVVELDEPVVPEEVGYVLGVVLARLGDEVSEAAHQFEAHLIFSVHLRVLHRRKETRVSILAFHFEARHPGDVVDTGALVEKFLMLDTNVCGYLARTVRDAVAEPDALCLGACRV